MRLVHQTVERFGKVDVLINNAGTNPYFGPMLEADMGAWEKTFEVNLKGYLLVRTRGGVRHCIARQAPKRAIVSIASITPGLVASRCRAFYAATKGGRHLDDQDAGGGASRPPISA